MSRSGTGHRGMDGVKFLLVIKSNSEAMTQRIGSILGAQAPAGTVIALNGELGAGKTVFARGFARGLGVDGIVSSPSYVLMNYYRGRLELYHFDFYRLEDEDELAELGLEEYLYGEGITLIEWADKFPRILPSSRLEIDISKDPADIEHSRILCLKPLGQFSGSLLEELKRVASAGS